MRRRAGSVNPRLLAAGVVASLLVACGRPSAGPAGPSLNPSSPPTPTPSATTCVSHDLPAARANASMAYMPNLSQVVLFGGANSNPGFLGDTWTWKGGCWTTTTSAGPSPRMGMAMAYDPTRHTVIAFGGRTDPSKQIFSSETWAWDGAAWSLHSSNGPSLQFGWAAFDPTSGRILLYASTNGVASTWTWDGARWNAVTGERPPSGARQVWRPILSRASRSCSAGWPIRPRHTSMTLGPGMGSAGFTLRPYTVRRRGLRRRWRRHPATKKYCSSAVDLVPCISRTHGRGTELIGRRRLARVDVSMQWPSMSATRYWCSAV